MSFILDALKRAERERKLEKAPDLSAIYQEEHPNRRRYRPWVRGGGVALVLLAAVGFMFWPKEPYTPAPPVKSPSAPLSTAGKTAKTALPPPSVHPSGEKRQTAGKEGPVSKKPLAVSQKTPRQKADAVGRSPEKAAPSPEKHITAPEPARKSVVSSAGRRRLTTTTKGVPKSAQKPALPLYNDLPEEIRSVLGPLEINVHMYSPDPSERRVFINMKGYREGDPIGENGFKVVAITAHGVVIDYGRGEALLEVRGK